LGRREEGFHAVETLMVPIRLADSVSFAPLHPSDCPAPSEIRLNILLAGLLRSRQESAPIPAGPQNRIVRALRLLQQRSGCGLGAQVELVKRIPAAAGWGGGSSDAAAVLRLANRSWGIHWNLERLAELAAEIGSDVPFFLEGGAAFCRGRGEKIERLPPIGPLDVVIVKPPVELSTAEVYHAYDVMQGGTSGQSAAPLADLAAGRASELGRRMRNALQQAASSLSPWVDRLRAAFDELDFVGHQLSGSGSAYFGVCRHAQHARRLADILRSRQLGLVYATRSCP
jgi:4-diphosphocytidyl-2-C-methyl-D-erythritol kinase